MAETEVKGQITGGGGQAEAPAKPFGPVAAGFLSAGIAAVVLGILTTLTEANATIKSKLEFSSRVGSLSGKTIITVIVYFGVWAILGVAWRGKEVDPKKVFTWTAVLVGIALVLTFPLFFQLFAPEA